MLHKVKFSLIIKNDNSIRNMRRKNETLMKIHFFFNICIDVYFV